MLERSGILVAASLLPSIGALIGLGVSPVVESSWDAEMTYLIHAWFGLPAIVAGCRYGAGRRVHPRLLALVPTGAVVAGLAGIALGLGVGATSSVGGGHDLVAQGLVLAVFLGLALAEGAAIAAIIAGTSIRGRLGRTVRAAGFAGGVLTAALMMSTTMEPLTEPLVSPVGGTGELLAVVGLPTLWAVLAAVAMDRMDTMPEFGGRVERPRVGFTCPRCGTRQRQAGASGCRRCGLDVRIEVL